MSGLLLARVLEPRRLSDAEARAVLERLLAPATTDVERAGILVGLAGRRTDAVELTAFAREMRRRATPFDLPSGDAALTRRAAKISSVYAARSPAPLAS